ncbi:MAG: hypothetical protein ACREC5_02575, partial [Thermoplasmata archaeon]
RRPWPRRAPRRSIVPVPEEFVKKRTEVTVSRASLKDLSCRRCGAEMNDTNIRGGLAKCEYCGHVFSLEVDGRSAL